MSLVDIKCPNCGASIQLDGSRECGFCSYCGSKVQIQDAINKIKIDKSGDIKNYLAVGRAAAEIGNGQEACEYANKVLEIDPRNAEAWELKMSGIGCMPGYNCHQMLAAGNKALEICNSPEMKDRIYMSYLSLSPLYLREACDKLLQNLRALKDLYESYGVLDSSTASERMLEYDIMARSLCDDIAQIPTLRFAVPDEEIEKNEEFAEITVEIAKEWIACGLALNRRYNTYGAYISDEGLEYWKDTLEKIKRGLNGKFLTQEISADNFVISKPSIQTDVLSDRHQPFPPNNEGCYIATAVYGSYEASEVMVLRHFRDNTLKRSYLGKWFIEIYYFLSPPIAEKLKDAKLVNQVVRSILNKLVRHLEKRK